MDRAVKIAAALALTLAAALALAYILWPQATLTKRMAYSAAAVEHILSGARTVEIDAGFDEPPYIADDFSLLSEIEGVDAEGWDGRELVPAGVLTAESVALRLPVFLGAGREALRFGAGLVELPANGSAVSYALAGVRGASEGDRFADISKLAVGDSVTYTLAGAQKELGYTVREVKTVPASALATELGVEHIESWLALVSPHRSVSAERFTVVWCRLDGESGS